jgi:hypothetical protein
MRIIEAVLQSMFFDRCHVIHARSVKAHYGLSMNNYRLNKAAAITWVKQFIEQNPQVFHESLTLLAPKKQDDLADALLLVLYYLDTYSKQLK